MDPNHLTFDSIPERFFEKVNFDDNKRMKNYSACKEFIKTFWLRYQGQLCQQFTHFIHHDAIRPHKNIKLFRRPFFFKKNLKTDEGTFFRN